MEPSLSQLLTDNASEIAALRSLLSDVLDASRHDDFWLLRYVLSNKTAAAAEEPARFTINYFKEHADSIKAIVEEGKKCPGEDLINKFQVVGDHKHTSTGEPIFIIRTALSNPKALMDNVPFDDVLNFMILNRLKTLADCEAASRRENRLIKTITLLDMQGMSMARIPDSRFIKVLGDSSKLSEKMFPQLLGKTIYVNAPSWMVWAFKTVLLPVLSKKTIEKTVFCPGNSSGKNNMADCPYLSRYLKAADLPSFLGGQCNCIGGCVGGVPNSQTTPVTEISGDGGVSLTVASRNVEIVSYPLLAGTKARYMLAVGVGQNIQVRVTFTPRDSDKSQVIVAPQVIEGAKKKLLLGKSKTDASGEEYAISGDFTAKSQGIFAIEFDNSQSWMRSKTVSYLFETVMEGEE
ncbi:hypothetical protein CcCBS67573_g07329 [Chytriomyces confervae]|uniref:CRAL-TRIO domain-containing protein n=1 Tax=Chytriomyces confervae TaxID=246404 RepID=A0A507EVQ7_9FUNG|nr:hypothetical protein HDU80_005977 [Chytriomyces hyalinus]TPX67981.1 hypothetical protein CcCBS67573_g07329 [Chytriomyces confervae]